MRASNACEACRIKKIRCDERKPCSNCKRKALSCIYSENIQPSKLERAFKMLPERVDSMDNKIERLITIMTANSSNHNTSSNSEKPVSFEDFFEVKFDEKEHKTFSQDSFFVNGVDIFNNDDPYFLPNFHEATLIEGNETHEKEAEAKIQRREIQFIHESKYSLKGRVDIEKIEPIDLSDRNIEFLEDAFLSFIYSSYPILRRSELTKIRNSVKNTRLGMDTHSCIFLLVLALGSVAASEDSAYFWRDNRYHDYKSKVSPPPGYNYLWAALGMFARIRSIQETGKDMIIILLLISIYYLKIVLLEDHWKTLKDCADELYVFIMHNDQKNIQESEVNILFWICIHLERNVSNVGRLKRTCLSNIQEMVLLPCGSDVISSSHGDNSIDLFMQNILLSNLTDKALALLESEESLPLGKRLEIFLRFENNLNSWRYSLPFSYQWDDDIYHGTNKLYTNPVRFRYYMCYIFLSNLLISASMKLTEAIPYEVQYIIQKCIIFTVRALDLFSQAKCSQLNPCLVFKMGSALEIFCESTNLVDYQSIKKGNSILFSGFHTNIKNALEIIGSYALHSPLIEKKYENCKKQLEDIWKN